MGAQNTKHKNVYRPMEPEYKNENIATERDESRHGSDMEADQRKITVLIVGAGMRGQIYATYARDFPSRMQVVGVAEPIRHRRELMRTLYKIDEKYIFDDWKDVIELDLLLFRTMSVGWLQIYRKGGCKLSAQKIKEIRRAVRKVSRISYYFIGRVARTVHLVTLPNEQWCSVLVKRVGTRNRICETGPFGIMKNYPNSFLFYY